MEREIRIDDARLLPGSYRNFSGRPTPFNKAGGARSFCIALPPDQAEWFINNGFNVQTRPHPNDPDAVTLILSIKVSFNPAIPPNIIMISGNQGTRLTEETVGLLDSAEIQTADIVIHPYEFNVNGRSGYSAYLNTMYVTLRENPYAEKYKNIVMSNPSGDEGVPFN